MLQQDYNRPSDISQLKWFQEKETLNTSARYSSPQRWSQFYRPKSITIIKPFLGGSLEFQSGTPANGQQSLNWSSVYLSTATRIGVFVWPAGLLSSPRARHYLHTLGSTSHQFCKVWEFSKRARSLPNIVAANIDSLQLDEGIRSCCYSFPAQPVLGNPQLFETKKPSSDG